MTSPTADELFDEQLYQDKRCHICMDVVPDTEGVRCFAFPGKHYFLCSGCWVRVRATYSSNVRRRLERGGLLQWALRAMRNA